MILMRLMILSLFHRKFNKKGIFEVVGGLMVFVIVCIVILLALGIFFNRVDPALKKVMNIVNESHVESVTSHNIISNMYNDYSGYFDSAFLLVFGVFWIAGLLIGYYVDYGRFVLVLMIFILIALLFVAGMLSNYWQETGADSSMAGRTSYPFTYWILDHLMLAILLIVGSSLVVNLIKDNG